MRKPIYQKTNNEKRGKGEQQQKKNKNRPEKSKRIKSTNTAPSLDAQKRCTDSGK